jgi:hypothetical protein
MTSTSTALPDPDAHPRIRLLVVYGYPRSIYDWTTRTVRRAHLGDPGRPVERRQVQYIHTNERNGSLRLRGLGYGVGLVLLADVAESADVHLANGLDALLRAGAVALAPTWCPGCSGPIHAAHGPYHDGAGERVCAICHARANPELADAITRALRSLKPTVVDRG